MVMNPAWALIGGYWLMSAVLIAVAYLFLGWNPSLGPDGEDVPAPPLDRWADRRAERK